MSVVEMSVLDQADAFVRLLKSNEREHRSEMKRLAAELLKVQNELAVSNGKLQRANDELMVMRKQVKPLLRIAERSSHDRDAINSANARVLQLLGRIERVEADNRLLKDKLRAIPLSKPAVFDRFDRLNEIEFLAEQGMTGEQIADALGSSMESLERSCLRLKEKQLAALFRKKVAA